MRLLLAVVALALALPVVDAHNGLGFPHVNPLTVDLAPGNTTAEELAFVESMGFQQGDTSATDFEAGALFVVSIVPPANGSVVVALKQGHEDAPGPEVANWTVLGSGTQILGARLPVTGRYTLWFHNPEPHGVRTSFFYDQSCNCAGKPIPSEIPQGLVIFNADAFHAGWMHAQVYEPPALHAQLRMGTMPPNGTFAQFHELLRSDNAKAVQGAEGRVHDFNFTTEAGQRYYFLAQGVSLDASKLPRDPEQRVGALTLTPLYETGFAAGPSKTPLPAVVGLAALAAGALLLRKR